METMFWWMALSVLLVDQLSKQWALTALRFDQSVPVIPGIFSLTLTPNTGIAFGMLSGKGWLTLPFTVVVVAGAVVYQFRGRPSRGISALTGLLVGGALGNFIDRLRFGFVVDMFDFVIWPVFNVADVAITTSLLGLMAVQLFARDEPSQTESSPEEPRL
ncbi:MAG: signal peptidase II [Armatimonadota bacterium]